jgi:hypothetical protein
MVFEQDEYPCSDCKSNIKTCHHEDERDWDWSTDDVCPGRVNNRPDAVKP